MSPTKYGDSAAISKNERSIGMKMNRVLRASVFAALLTFFLLPAAAHAQSVVFVNCPGVSGGPTTLISDAVSAATVPTIINVTGTCSENVQINNARNITIVGLGGANILEPNGNDAFDISQSQGITLENLDISSTGPEAGGVVITDASEVHIVGCNIHNNQGVGVDADTGSTLILRRTTIQNNNPNDGLDVTDNSTADVAFTTIQNNGNSANGGVGVFLTGSSTALFRQTNSILNNADFGILVVNLSHVRFQSAFTGRFTTVQGHNVDGILVRKQSHVQINGASPQVIQSNGAACPLDATCGGISVEANSTVHVNNGTISGNHGSGISAQQGANVRLSGATVSNNTGDGVHLQWISTGDFLSGSGNTITGNGGKSVFCDTTSLAVGDLSGFSNLGCAQIARSVGPPRPGAIR
jgi:hypothetical protein